MPTIPGETSQPTKNDPEKDLKDIHRFYEYSSTPIPYFFLSTRSYLTLKTIQFPLQDAEWDPQNLVAHITFLHQLNAGSQIPDDQILEAYANELRLALDKMNAYEAAIEINSGYMIDDQPILDFQQALTSAKQEIEDILQGLEKSELILHLDEWDAVAIQEELVPAIEKELGSIDPATFMRGKTMQSFGLDPISEERLYLVTIINQALGTIPNTEDEYYQGLAEEKSKIINSLNLLVNTQRTRLMNQWLELNRQQVQIDLSETELMFSEASEQGSQEQTLVKQLAELELLSRYLATLNGEYREEEKASTRFGFSTKSTDTLKRLAKDSSDWDPLFAIKLALVLDEADNDIEKGLTDYEEQYKLALEETLRRVQILLIKISLELKESAKTLKGAKAEKQSYLDSTYGLEDEVSEQLNWSVEKEESKNQARQNKYQDLKALEAEIERKIEMLNSNNNKNDN